ncbi:presequence protease [Anaeramoeba flamelloides]|uniref:Presequence protease n=1 Tax=Anaeramoeba flamelloides TaxID=1746091 RepID=A0ABQ8YR97_9EUKA|nr:presequence protease [Anaeramoeba flamelloides]
MTFRFSAFVIILGIALSFFFLQINKNNSKQNGHWEVDVEIPLENNVKVTKYHSKKTQLKVTIVDVPTPIVNGYFVLATEANDNFGCPHVLEHMIFLGSDDYPYKGIIDSIANRCLGTGTNAWTATDHTAYTVSTAGTEGFLNILPVFIDHILFPTLTEDGFKTEIHHIDENGEDNGVVYNEMKGTENTPESLTYHALTRMIFKNTSFASETGGKVSDLRNLKLETVKEFHEKYYRSSNLELIITGKIQPEEIFERLGKIENKIISKQEGALYKNDTSQPNEISERPFSTRVPKFLKSEEKTIVFPEDDEESTGLVSISQRIGKYSDFELTNSMIILWSYLTSSTISPLQQALVEIEDPYCTIIDYSFLEFSETASLISFEGVPKKKLKSIQEKFFEILNKELDKGIDLERIRIIIKNSKLKYLKLFETSPQSLIVNELIKDFLYGNQANDYFELQETLRVIEITDNLIAKPQDYWNNLLNDKIINEPYATVISEPSKEKSTQDQTMEKERLLKQKEGLGEERLEELQRKLKNSIKINNIEAPKEVLLEFQIPNVNKIELISIPFQINEELNKNYFDHTMSKKLYNHLKLTKINNNDTSNGILPIWNQFDHIDSLFVTIRVIIDTTHLPANYRKYLTLYKDISFKSPIVRDDQIIDQEQFIKDLEKDTISYSTQIGFGGSGSFMTGAFGQYFIFTISGEISKYQLLIDYLKENIWNTFFTAEKLKIAAQNLIIDVDTFKRNGISIALESLRYKIFNKEKSNHVATNFMLQQKFLTDFLKQLDENEEETIQEFTKFRDLLVSNLTNFKIHVTSNLFKIENPKLPWISNSFIPKKIFDFDDPKNNQERLQKSYPISNNYVYSAELLNSNCIEKSDQSKEGGETIANNDEKNEFIEKNLIGKTKNNIIIGLGSIDSGYSAHVANSISAYDDQDYPALLVTIEYLSTMNSFIWKRIRGQGLAYGAGIFSIPEQGNLYFYLYRSGNIALAYREALQIFQSLIDGELKFDDDEIDSAKSSLYSSIIKNLETPSHASVQNLINNFKKIPNYSQYILNRIQQVSKEEMIHVLKTHLIKLFEDDANSFIILNPLKAEETFEGLQDIVKEVQNVESLEKFYFD